MNELPLAPLKRIVKNNGASRISGEGLTAFNDAVEQMAETLAERSGELAAHAGRVTIKKEDVVMASKFLGL